MAEMVAKPCIGATMASRKGRVVIGVKSGGMVKIASEDRGTAIHRLCLKLMPCLIQHTDDNTLWLHTEDFKLLEITSGDPVTVTPSNEAEEFP